MLSYTILSQGINHYRLFNRFLLGFCCGLYLCKSTVLDSLDKISRRVCHVTALFAIAQPHDISQFKVVG